jgi:hypothetical protein|uniref:C3H1-type domain-containing protein n=1 Tax=Eutreptiella gymnastica TaxID=73025 RepID=A0A7S4FQM8_9EUGL|eukprot:CAMPEP_0174302570 /NCGR_PEP_ID=MMETSP0809-20121228/59696_1 /TAXON_ID=73025 ORGANISM="Eutreptiella gymnastica-like, Strain CCMP1594" /NCGR_SAMPLE_ID=MMETSP0809 /ASSEMBLY_ACC=CAM_ASM_000658 /LENGTH=774 /DNA_ID=CAMNT_0015408487 /DNA_START=32 /DNA_END=2356 /DNA_ORIENTATION=-
MSNHSNTTARGIRVTGSFAKPSKGMNDRRQTEAVLQFIGRLFQPSEDAIPVVHPSFKALGRIWVPWSVVEHTSGLDKVLQNRLHAPSLCMLFQNGRCKSWSRCNQIHVGYEWAKEAEYALQKAAVNNCCETCGDLPSAKHRAFQMLSSCDVMLQVPGMDPIPVPVRRLAATTFWQRMQGLTPGPSLIFTPDRICMLHQKNKCKYGVECKNVHFCRSLWRETLRVIKTTPGAEFDPTWDSILELPVPDVPNPRPSAGTVAPHTKGDSFTEQHPVPLQTADTTFFDTQPGPLAAASNFGQQEGSSHTFFSKAPGPSSPLKINKGTFFGEQRGSPCPQEQQQQHMLFSKPPTTLPPPSLKAPLKGFVGGQHSPSSPVEAYSPHEGMFFNAQRDNGLPPPPPGLPPALPKRSRNILAIVHPESGEELKVEQTAPANESTSMPATPLAPSAVAEGAGDPVDTTDPSSPVFSRVHSLPTAFEDPAIVSMSVYIPEADSTQRDIEESKTHHWGAHLHVQPLAAAPQPPKTVTPIGPEDVETSSTEDGSLGSDCQSAATARGSFGSDLALRGTKAALSAAPQGSSEPSEVMGDSFGSDSASSAGAKSSAALDEVKQAPMSRDIFGSDLGSTEWQESPVHAGGKGGFGSEWASASSPMRGWSRGSPTKFSGKRDYFKSDLVSLGKGSSGASDSWGSDSGSPRSRGRDFPKPASQFAPGSPSSGRSLQDCDGKKLWAQKSEDSRGKFKKVNLGMLGVELTEGPRPNGGFSAGRGVPLRPVTTSV